MVSREFKGVAKKSQADDVLGRVADGIDTPDYEAHTGLLLDARDQLPETATLTEAAMIFRHMATGFLGRGQTHAARLAEGLETTALAERNRAFAVPVVAPNAVTPGIALSGPSTGMHA